VYSKMESQPKSHKQVRESIFLKLTVAAFDNNLVRLSLTKNFSKNTKRSLDLLPKSFLLSCIIEGNTICFPINSTCKFKDDDLRALFVVNSKNNLDPRIHFSISRFCEGSPDIKLVTPETVEMVLQQQTQQYLNSQVEFIGKQIMLPSIIQENRSDFGNKTRDLLVFLEKFLVNENRTKLLSNAATVNFKKMDSRTCLWDLCWDSIFEYSPSFNKTEITSCANTNNEVN